MAPLISNSSVGDYSTKPYLRLGLIGVGHITALLKDLKNYLPFFSDPLMDTGTFKSLVINSRSLNILPIQLILYLKKSAVFYEYGSAKL